MKYLLFLTLLLNEWQAVAQFEPIDEKGLEVIYVSMLGFDDNSGSKDAPLKSVVRALELAFEKKAKGKGIKVYIHPGIYREGKEYESWAFVKRINMEELSDAPLIIEGAMSEPSANTSTPAVVITGASDMSGNWQRNADGTWSKPWNFALGMARNTSPNGVSDAFLRGEVLSLNGKMFYQINPPNHININSDSKGRFGGFVEGGGNSDDGINGQRLTTEEGCFWITDAEINERNEVRKPGVITVKMPKVFPSDFNMNNPNNQVEVTTRKMGLYLSVSGASASTKPMNLILRNLTITHWAENPLLISGCNNVLIENCKFVYNKMGGAKFANCNRLTFRNCDFSGNGSHGLGADLSNTLMEYCKFNNNSRQGEIVGYTGWSVCGVKFMSLKATNYRIKLFRCEAIGNRSTGFWWDTGNSECIMEECVAMYNSSNGAFIEDNNSRENNYEHLVENAGIENLGNRPTVTARFCIFAHNGPLPGTEKYRTNTGKGIFFAENENAVIENSLIYDNDIQVGTYNNDRGENRNFTFRGNIIAAQHLRQRLYAVGSAWDLAEKIYRINKKNGDTLAVMKSGWYGLIDGMSATTDYNLYYFPVEKAFPLREKLWGTNRWTDSNTPYNNGMPDLTLADWRKMHLANPHNGFADKSVDARSRLMLGAYDERKPLVVIVGSHQLKQSLHNATSSIIIQRVSPMGYNEPLLVHYKIEPQGKGKTGKVHFGKATIPAGERSVEIKVSDLKRTMKNGTAEFLMSLENPTNSYVAGLSKIRF